MNFPEYRFYDVELSNNFSDRKDICKKLKFVHPFFQEDFGEVSFSHSLALNFKGNWIMEDDSIRMKSFFESLSFFNFARGHCLCSGLGMGIRETLLLQNKNVSKITILENNFDLIEYHRKNKTPFVEHVEIIHCDASIYVGSCDTLFIDHFTYNVENFLQVRAILNELKVVTNNINHHNFWFRGLEDICINCEPNSRYKIYLILKEKYSTLPDLSNKLFNDLLMIYENKDENLKDIKTIIDNSFIKNVK
jgi:hypothetical protein